MEFEGIVSDLTTALQLLKNNSSTEPGQLRFVQRPLALMLAQVNRVEEGLNLMAEVAASSREMESADSPIVRSDYWNAFEMARRCSDYEAALKFYKVLEELPRPDDSELADSFDFVLAGAYCHARLDNHFEATSYARRALNLIEGETSQAMSQKRLSALHLLGRLQRKQNLIEEAVEIRLLELALMEQLFGAESPALLSVLDLLIEHYGTLRQMDEMGRLVVRRRRIKRIMDA